VVTPVLELDARARYEVLDSRGDQNLTGIRRGLHSSREVDGDACYIVTSPLHFTGVHTCPDMKVQALDRFLDR
jgi:hypothetical protein